MSLRSTRVDGHTLLQEGRASYDEYGQRIWDRPGQPPKEEELRARCSCGEMSPPSLSVQKARAWHRQHKEDVAAVPKPGWGR